MKVASLILALVCTRCVGQPACPATARTTSTAIETCWAVYYSRAYGVPPEFVQAVIDIESAWQPYVVSSTGAAGVMQLMPPTAFAFGVTNRFRVEENIRGGVAYLAYLIPRFGGDLRLVAAAYYAGEHRIKKQGLQCTDVEICRYVREVQRLFAKRQAAARAASPNSQRRTSMNRIKAAIGIALACLCAGAQTPDVRPQIAGRPFQEGQVTVVYLAPRFATAIRMPDAINSVVLGDPASFSAEHSEREPQIVFVKPITEKAAQTNLLISTSHGYQASLLLISQGDTASAHPNVDFLMRYRPAGRFIVEPSMPSGSVAQTVALNESARPLKPNATDAAHSDSPAVRPVSLNMGGGPVANAAQNGIPPETHSGDSSLDLVGLLRRQEEAPLPTLYGEKPGLASPGKQILQAGVSEVIDQGREVIVLFSVLNVQRHAVELMPPQVQLGGKVKRGAIVHHLVWSNSEQLPVEDFRINRRRIGPGERADGVLIFQRPSFKQSNETLLLQMADSGAVDRPALAPIGFGTSVTREKGVNK